MNNDLGALLLSLTGNDEAPVEPLPASIQAKRLSDLYRRYIEPCPFKPGDFVTTAAGSTMANTGVPHIVLEVIEPRYVWEAEGSHDTSTSCYGRRIDMRVAVFQGGVPGKLVGYWVESYLFEAWGGNIAA